MTKKELRDAVVLEAQKRDAIIEEANKAYKAQVARLREQYIEDNKPNIKVGDVIKGQVYFQGQQITLKVEKITLNRKSGYKYYGTRLTANGEIAKHQLANGAGLLQQYITSVNGNPVDVITN